ncbi:dTMP kinase [Candidatus Micrarchaeota archaeon]|nr:dTMP kinase [Candidatus Micrarchaeota archaeon]MBD3417520.1 dTMP kinase [Candidatus Micrarchaeota archaeon]
MVGGNIKFVLEGVDGCGKDTQIALLKEKIDFTHFKYPTPEFPSIREYLEKKREISPKSLFLLFLADIANEQERLADTLETCIIDRYVFSTIAYDKHFSYGQAKDLVSDIGFVRPDKVILLDLSPEVAHERKIKQKQKEGKDPDRYDEDTGYLKHVRERFLTLKEDSFLCQEWVVLDATKPPGELHKEILKLIS